MLYRHNMMSRQMHRWSHMTKASERMLFCHNAKFQYLHGSWFLVVLKLHLSGTGMSSSAWSHSSVVSGLVDPVDPQSTGLHWFGVELGMPSGWLSFSQSTCNASSACDTGFGSLLPPPQQHFYLLPVPGYCWWTTGNFCAGYGCTFPCL